MSGGSMNYLCRSVEDADFKINTPEREAFMKHLSKVAKALHDIEWVDSCDYGPGDENEAIRECLSETIILNEILLKKLRMGYESFNSNKFIDCKIFNGE